MYAKGVMPVVAFGYDRRMARPTFQAPKGTRDFYPRDLLRRRYIEKMWRDTSIRHGFEEIEGPTFETAALYKVKSGEGILGEMFGVFSGKSEEDLRQVREMGEAPLALRPEFTPTLARMVAARAAELPKPCRWFTAGPYFRAERPQRGRLREFHQWNVDVIGDDGPAADADVIACAVGLLMELGLGVEDVRVRFSHRRVLTEVLSRMGIDAEHMASAFVLLDRRDRLRDDDLEAMAFEFGLSGGDFIAFLKRPRGPTDLRGVLEWAPGGSASANLDLAAAIVGVEEELESSGIGAWCQADLNIVRGLAYYTGTVFEMYEAAEGRRAVAGGGRYDDLIELFGGPPTSAVGFGMGDVVLGNLLEDRGLMPEGEALLEAVSAPSASLRPDVFVIANELEESQRAVRPLVARLRRGVEAEGWLSREGRRPWDTDRYAVPPLHARQSYKATKNIGKLLREASESHARLAAIVESGEHCTVKDLRTGEQWREVPLGEVGLRAAGGGWRGVS